MNVCILEHPRIPSAKHFNDIANTPLWSCLMGRYAAAALMQTGHAVTWLDGAGRQMDFDQTHDRVLQLAPDLLAVNAVYFWEHTPRLLDFLTGLKDHRPTMHITLFGFFPSLAFERLLGQCPAVDSVCVGECERTLDELAAAIDCENDWRAIPGLAFRQKGTPVFPMHRPPVDDPDRLAFPFYPEDAHGETDTAVVLASRGCYNHCTFCPIPVFYSRGALWRGRSPANVLGEVQWLMDKGYRQFYFVDPNFVGPGRAGRRRTLELMTRLAPLKIRFGMETRPSDLDSDLLSAMTDAGLESLLLGIESGSPRVLGNLSKHASINVSSRAIDLCRRAGIEPEVGFLMHTPDAGLEDLTHNLAFLEDNALLDRLERTANLLCHRQIVFLGTRGHGQYREEGRISGTDPLGFEARIAWKDPRAEWVADVMVPVCLDVLRLTGDPQSPLYWKTASQHRQVANRVNARLVDVFRQTVGQAQEEAMRPPVASARHTARERVLAGLNAI